MASDLQESRAAQGPTPPSPSPDWSTDAVPLKDFSSKRQVPGFAKVVKGSYMTLGHSKFSFQKQHQEVFIHSMRVSVKVLAHCLRRVDSHHGIVRRSPSGHHNMYAATRLYALDQRLAVPISYQGWFELLSEDGKSARPICSVHELSKARPSRCLVRENIKAYVSNGEQKLSFDNTRIIIAGEQLLLNGEISLPANIENKKVKLLRCIDSKNETVYLSFDQKGTFSPIAEEGDFTGVFNIRDVVRRFRLPLTVKLVMGVTPKVDPSRFSGLIRLDWVYTDETAFVCPIEKNHVRLLPVPRDTPLQLVAANNQQAMKTTELYRNMMTKCNRMISNYNNTLHLIVQVPDVVTKSRGSSSNANVFSMPLDAAMSPTPPSVQSRRREERLMNEIDDLYAYVRDGGAPPRTSKFTYDSDEESYWEEPAYEPLDEFRARLKAIEAGEKVTYPDQYKPRDPNQLALDLEATATRQPGNMSQSISNGSSQETGSGRQQNKPVAPSLPPRPDILPNSPQIAVSQSSPSAKHANMANHQIQTAPPKPPSSHPPNSPFRRMSSTETVTTVSNLGLVSSAQSSVSLASKPPQPATPQRQPSPRNPSQRFNHSKSTGDVRQHQRSGISRRLSGSHESNSTSGSSNGNGQRNFGRDFRDSDISSLTRAGSSGSSGNREPSTNARLSNIKKKMQTLYL